MKLSITSKQAGYIGVSVIAARTFLAMTVDGAEYLNSGWLCALCGGVLCIPAVIAADRLNRSPENMPRALYRLIFAMVGALSVYQAAVMTGLVNDSVSFSNLKTLPPTILLAVMLLAGFYVIMKNGAGIGNASKIWWLLFSLLFGAMLLANMQNLRHLWLAPVLGPGAKMIARGAVSAAGCILSGALIHVAADSEGKNTHGCLKTVVIGSIISAVLCLYWSSMTPSQPAATGDRLSGIERLLSNGRTSLAVQLPMNIIWFLGYTAALFGSCFCSAMCLQRFFIKGSSRLHAFASVILIALAAISGIAESKLAAEVSLFIWLPFTVALIIASIYYSFRSRGRCSQNS